MPRNIIETLNPATEKIIKQYEIFTSEQINRTIQQTAKTYLTWRNTSFAQRSALMQRLAQLLRAQKNKLAQIITDEMGKPLTDSQAEIEKCAWLCEYNAEHAPALLQPQIIPTEAKQSYVAYEPTGVILAIMPWNFPFWQVFRFAVLNLMAGNTCLLKHASIVTGCALAIEKIIVAAGFPENAFRTLVISSAQVNGVIQHPAITGVTLTGSEDAGKQVAAAAGAALKKVVLELGGSDPYIILEDADLELAAKACVQSRLSNSGQVCIAAKRLIVVDRIYNDFKKLVIAECERYTVGDPNLTTTKLGPLARNDLREQVQRQVEDSLNAGAHLVMSGTVPNSAGFYYPVTLLENVTIGMPAFDEEIFGPVVSLIHTYSESDAIELANHTRFGLGAAIFSQNIQRANEIARTQLQAGACAVNDFVKSDPRLPFGGIKASGFGRELAKEGLTAFMNIKSMVVN